MNKMNKMNHEFLPEHWSIIKSYAGIYHIRTDWDLMKLDHNIMYKILAMVSPNDIQHMKFQCNETRVKCIWKHLHKKKLYDADILINSNLIKNNKNNRII